MKAVVYAWGKIPSAAAMVTRSRSKTARVWIDSTSCGETICVDAGRSEGHM
jgi:hypothetical protein